MNTSPKKGLKTNWDIGFEAGRLQGLNEALDVMPDWEENAGPSVALNEWETKIKSLIDKK